MNHAEAVTVLRHLLEETIAYRPSHCADRGRYDQQLRAKYAQEILALRKAIKALEEPAT